MLISAKQLKNLRVETQSGQYLGRVNSFELETDSGKIEKYHIKGKNLISGLFEDQLIINRNQVISMDAEKMVVRDNVVKAATGAIDLEPEVEKIEGVEPVITSKKA